MGTKGLKNRKVAADEIWTCSICLDEIGVGECGGSTKSGDGECNHKFHFHCITTWVDKSNNSASSSRAPCPLFAEGAFLLMDPCKYK